jgi:probable phosphoglycerate mutase
VPGGERAADVGGRADRVIDRVRRSEEDTLCVAHGHLLRVLAARWLGLPPVAGRLFLLRTGAVCVLGWEVDWPAIEAWNLGV